MRIARLGLTLLLASTGASLTACGGDGEAPAPPRPPPVSTPTVSWDLGRLPPTGPVLEEWVTPQDVRVRVLRRPPVEAVPPETPIDLHYRGYLRSGERFVDQIVRVGPPERAKLLAGLREGLERMQPGESRRVLVPAAQAFGWERPKPELPAGADVVFDVMWPVFSVVDLRPGGGREAAQGDEVVVHYRGEIEGGLGGAAVEFENSRTARKGEPIPLRLEEGRTIAGFVRGMPGMRVGGLRRLALPSWFAYGAEGLPALKIPPFADLVFVVELLEVRAAQPGRAPDSPPPLR